MERIEMQAALNSAVEEVLETMFFTAPLGSAEGARAETVETPLLAARLEFQGSPPGEFSLRVPTAAARSVAAGFLGLDEPEVSDEQCGEVLCEMANMICGSSLSRLENETVFHLLHPQLVRAEDASKPEAVQRWFDLGNGILSVSLEVRQPV